MMCNEFLYNIFLIFLHQHEFLRLREAPVILGVTEESVRISLREEMDQISKDELKHFFNYARIIITDDV